MKYTTLRDDIVAILHSSEYNLNLQFFDKDENTTLDVSELKWIYIKNANIMIEINLDDENNLISIWKNNETLTPDLKSIIKQIRKLAMDNGIKMEVDEYNNLDKNKIYNIVKKEVEIENNKKVDESANKKLNNVINILNSIKKPSDFYLSEQLSVKNKMKVYDLFEQELSSFKKSFNDINIKNLCNDIKTYNDYRKLSNYNLSDNQIGIMETVSTFIKNCLKNEVEPTKAKSIYILENAKTYKATTSKNIDNLTKAYNHLVSLSENITKSCQLLSIIRRNKICETYNVSKNDLLDKWISRDKHIEIKPQEVFVIENSKGEKYFFNDDLKFGIKCLAEHINNGFSGNDETSDLIIAETIKFNHLNDFIKEYQTRYSFKPIIKEMYFMIEECVDKLLKHKEITKLQEVDCSRELSILEKKYGVKHPAMKYIAEIQAIDNLNYKSELFEERQKDKNILSNQLKNDNAVSSIMESGVIAINEIPDDINVSNYKMIMGEMLNNLKTLNKKTQSVLESYLFKNIHNQSIDKSQKIKFLKTLKKYIKK